MGRINVLEKAVSELIAAGEVIERPASIVKELLENAIDAKSDAITIEIKNGGITYIRITDNGIGFEKDDLPVAFLRHATSKVATTDDLDNISTLGFRGEALASIGAVSKVELFSKTRNDEFGTKIFIQGSENTGVETMGCPTGTTIIIRDLFYNVPARLKFLKKDSYEASQIQSIIEKIALSHPEISFKFIKDNKIIIHTPGDGKLLSAIYAVQGKDFAKSLIPVEYTYNDIRIEGFTSRDSAGRNNRKMQHFFVNDRYVKSYVCLAALEESYKNRLMVQRFPACVLKIYVDYSKVDVNVHPAKIEIRFTDESTIYKSLYFAISSALENSEDLKSQPLINATTPIKAKDPYVASKFKNDDIETKDNLQFKQNKTASMRLPLKEDTFRQMSTEEFKSVLKEESKSKNKPTSFDKLIAKEAFVKKNEDKTFVQPKPVSSTKDTKQKAYNKVDERNVEKIFDSFDFLNSKSFAKQNVVQPVEEPIAKEVEETINIKVIGEVFKTYVLFELNDLFVMLDKHAAHERIIFERLKKEISLQQSQILLNPISIDLAPDEKNAFDENKATLTKFGFDCQSDENASKVKILSVPMILSEFDAVEIFMDVLKNIMDLKEDVSPELYEELLHSMACKAAIKANSDHSIMELTELVEQVYRDKKIRHCPHGRPVFWVMTKNEMDKKFGRLG